MGADDIPDAFYDLALECSNDELMRRLDVDRETVRRWRKKTKLHQPRGIRLLPRMSTQNTGQTMTDLRLQFGWGSDTAFREAMRQSRPEIYRWATANGRRRSVEGLMRSVRVRGMSGRFTRSGE
jgi:hypothetical protein